jgi:uncharacterized protein (TIGR02217 family)
MVALDRLHAACRSVIGSDTHELPAAVSALASAALGVVGDAMTDIRKFVEARFPSAVAFGSSMTLEDKVSIVEASSGYELRTTEWDGSIREYDIASGIREIASEDVDEARMAMSRIVAFRNAVGGPLTGFRFEDTWDHTSADDGISDPAPDDQLLGTGDGTTTAFQLRKGYPIETISGDGIDAEVLTRWRRILKPVPGSVRIVVGDTVLTSGFSVNAKTGLVTLASAPASGAPVRAGFRFDTPVRFRDQKLTFRLENWMHASTTAALRELLHP